MALYGTLTERRETAISGSDVVMLEALADCGFHGNANA